LQGPERTFCILAWTKEAHESRVSDDHFTAAATYCSRDEGVNALALGSLLT
jgi:hypothetical protein